jgi:hypothetical protein
VNGRARISVDAVLRRRFAVNGKEPTTVMVVMVEQAFAHCPKALVRSDLWKAATRGRPKAVPTLGDFVAARDAGKAVPHSMQNIARAFRTSCASAWPGPARITEIFPDAGSTSTRSTVAPVSVTGRTARLSS